MNVRNVRVIMDERRVAVRMGVRFTGRIAGRVLVLVMYIMRVQMVVLHRHMLVPMRMPLAQ